MCHHLGLLPVPVAQGPVGGTTLRNEVLGVRREAEADVLLKRALRVVQNLFLSQCCDVENRYDWPLSFLFGHGYIAFVGTDGQCSCTLASGAERDELLHLLFSIAEHEISSRRIEDGVLVQVAHTVRHIPLEPVAIACLHRGYRHGGAGCLDPSVFETTTIARQQLCTAHA